MRAAFCKAADVEKRKTAYINGAVPHGGENRIDFTSLWELPRQITKNILKTKGGKYQSTVSKQYYTIVLGEEL